MGELPAMEGDAFDEGAPMSESGGGDFFSQELGTLLRMRYNTESYGQDRRGNLDIGTMQVASFQDAITFFDGQITLSDVNGVGYNLGVGFRWLGWTPFPLEPERITGFNFWADGSSTEAGSFFPQVGVGFESLGDMWDLRVNGYIPVGQESQIGEFSPTGAVSFDENFLVQEAIADRNTSFNVAEAEIARRIMPDRDAWAFAGPYVLGNDDQDAAGYRVGMRGYAYPDLLLQIAVTDDDIFKTNAAFSVTWFVGRTRNNFQPACGLPDRMREPVMRNDYVALQRTIEVGGEALTNADGEAFRFLHVDANAAAGGNGTFENPLDNVGNVEDNSQEDDIILLYSDGTFTGQSTLVLQDNQRLLGEGNGEFFTISTLQQGVVVIPETSPGARDGTRPIILGALGGAVQLADANEVANFNIDGTGSLAGVDGIFSPALGAGNPNIHDIDMEDVTGTGIQITPFTRIDEDNPLLMTVAGNVTIDDVSFLNMLGIEIDIDSATTTPFPDPNVTLQETIAISDIDSQNGSAEGLLLQNTHDGRTATITNYVNGAVGTPGSGGGNGTTGVLAFLSTGTDTFEGNVTLTNIDIFANTGFALHFQDIDAAAAVTITSGNGLTWNGVGGTGGGMRFDNFDGTVTANSSTLTNGDATLAGVRIEGASDGTFTFASTVEFNNVTGTAIDVDGRNGLLEEFTGVATFSGDVDNIAGRSVSIQGISGVGTSVTIGGDITETVASQGILVNQNSGGTILFSGDITQDLTANDGIELTANTGTDISFGGLLDIDIDGAGRAFTATGGGTLTASNTSNTVNTENGIAVEIEGMTINAAGANFANVNVAGSTTNGVQLVDNTGGPILIGTLNDPVGDSGTIANTAAEAIVIENSANVTVSSLIINSPGQTGVRVTKNTTGTQTVNLNDLRIGDNVAATAGSTQAIDVIGDGGATDTLNLTINDVDIQDATDRGIRISNVDSGTIQVNGTTIDGDDTTATAQGVEIIGSNATISFDGTTTIQQFDGTDFEVDGGTPAVTFNGDITNTTGQSIVVQNVTGGTVSFTSASAVTDTGAGILVTANTGGTTNFQGTYDLDTGANDAVTITNNTGATINFTPVSAAGSFDIDTTTGDGFVATGGGTLTVAGTGNTITTTTGRGLNIENMTIGAVDFESVNVNGADNGIRLVNNLTGTITVGDTGAAVGAGGTIQNTTNAGVHVENSNVVLNGVTVQNAGNVNNENGVDILHTNATTMNANLNRLTVTNATALRDGVVVNGTGGTGTFNANVQNLNVNVTGDGLVVDEGVTLTAGGTNTITSDTGVGLTVTDSAIAAAGANFQSVNVTNGATNGIVLQNLTGTGTLSVTGTGTTDASGGTLDTAGDAIVITNAANVSLNNIDVVGSANAVAITKNNTAAMTTTLTNVDVTSATNDGVNVNVTTSGVFDLTINDSDIAGVGNEGFELTAGGTATDVDVVIDQMTTSENLLVNTSNNTALDFRLTNSTINANTAMNINSSGNFDLLIENSSLDSATGITFDLALGANAQDGDIIIRNNATFEAGNGKALEMTAIGTNINVDLLITANTFTNSSAASETADIFVMGGALVDANITDNSFTNSLAADEFAMESDGSTTRINLNLVNNTTTGVYELTTTNQGVPGVDFNFGVVDRDDANANNVGTVNFNPIITDFEDIAGPIDPPVLP